MAIGSLGSIGAGAALVPLRDNMAGANVALALVVVVVAAAVVGGWKAGMVGAVCAALTFDFFFTVPYLSLTIESGDDVETTVLLLIVGAIVGSLSAWATRQHEAISASRGEVHRIHRVAERLAAEPVDAGVLVAVQAELTALLSLRDCHFEARPYTHSLPQLDHNGTFAVRPRDMVYAHGGFELPAGGVAVPVRSGGTEVGRLVLEPTAGVGVSLEQRLVAVVLADLLGAAAPVGATPVAE